MSSVEQHISHFEARLTRLEKLLEKQTVLLEVEKEKVEIYREIISQNTNIKLDHKTKPKLKQPQADVLVKTTEDNELTVDPKPEIPNKTTLIRVDELLDKINTNKTYSKNLSELKQLRWSMFSTVDTPSYIELCNNHIKKLKTYFASKGFSDKKIESQICKGLTAIELRLLKYPNYCNTQVDMDEIQQYQTALYNHSENNAVCVFDSSKTINNLFNYGIVILNMKVNITRIAGSKNIVYVKMPKSADKDPFSFYTLSSISKSNVKNWTMDCRLEDFTTNFSSNIIPYMVKTFRSIYYDVFGDNDYRPDYKTKCNVTEFDLEQLFRNILLVTNTSLLNTAIKNIIIENCTYNHSNDDKFNMKSDDALQRKRWGSFCKSENTQTIKSLFDTISKEELKSITTTS